MRIAIIAFVFSISLASAHADETADLIAKLANGDFQERQRASKALEALGVKAVASLQEAIRTGDLETQRRAETLLRRIDSQRHGKIFSEPRQAHLRFDKASLADVEKELQQLLGTEIFLTPRPVELKDKTITADTGKRPLWQALDELSRQSGLAFTPHHSVLTYPPVVDSFTHLAPLNGWTLDTKPANDFIRWADRTGALLVMARQPTKNSMEILAVPDTKLQALRRMQAIRLTGLRDRGGKLIPVLDVFSETQVNIDPEDRSDPAMDAPPPPPVMHRAFFTSKQNLDIDRVEGYTVLKVRSLDEVLTVQNVVRAEGKTHVEPKIGVSVTVQEVDFVEDGELRLKLLVQNFDRYIQVPEKPQVIRLRPGVLVVRGPADYVAESLHLVDRHGSILSHRLVEQPKLEKDGLHISVQFTIPQGSRADLALLIATPRLAVIEVPFTLRPAR